MKTKTCVICGRTVPKDQTKRTERGYVCRRHPGVEKPKEAK